MTPRTRARLAAVTAAAAVILAAQFLPLPPHIAGLIMGAVVAAILVPWWLAAALARR